MNLTQEDLDLWHNKIVIMDNGETRYIVMAALANQDGEGKHVIALMSESYSRDNPDWTVYHVDDSQCRALLARLTVVGAIDRTE